MPIMLISRVLDTLLSASLFLFAVIYGGRTEEPVIEQLTTERLSLGEGPHWDHTTQKLYFVDIDNQKIFRLDPATGQITSGYIANGPVGAIVPVEDSPDKFAVGVGTSFAIATWNSDTNSSNVPITVLTTVENDRTGTRFNDGKADSSGRMWIGTMGREVNGSVEPKQGALYSIGSDLTAKKEVTPVTISNGLAWNGNDDTFYYIDTGTRQVSAYDYVPQSGKISNKRVIFDLEKKNVTGLPDGMTIDTDGNLWVAVYLGGCVLNINPNNGELIRTIKIPAERVTSVTFGGPLLDILYVTTASRDLSEQELKAQPQAGHLVSIKGLGARGYLANSFKLPKK